MLGACSPFHERPGPSFMKGLVHRCERLSSHLGGAFFCICERPFFPFARGLLPLCEGSAPPIVRCLLWLVRGQPPLFSLLGCDTSDKLVRTLRGDPNDRLWKTRPGAALLLPF
jgi:hypothetical protein